MRSAQLPPGAPTLSSASTFSYAGLPGSYAGLSGSYVEN